MSTGRVQTDAPSTTGPLSGIRVLDISTVIAGPHLAMMLADFGADVIKFEHPQKGDPLRGTGYQKDGGLWWKMANRNKRCVTLNLNCYAVRNCSNNSRRQRMSSLKISAPEHWATGDLAGRHYMQSTPDWSWCA